MSEWLWDWSPEFQMYHVAQPTRGKSFRLEDSEILRIVREELADLIQPEAPDAPPENL